ncbi:MAG: flagellar hook-length control protein FliK [Zoogloeaceae bacterium]|jgi:flagellar hook-length control protein FliK|nr:flagellar hook-length control protein FliK [Zoogloeaceae bacterium]
MTITLVSALAALLGEQGAASQVAARGDRGEGGEFADLFSLLSGLPEEENLLAGTLPDADNPDGLLIDAGIAALSELLQPSTKGKSGPENLPEALSALLREKRKEKSLAAGDEGEEENIIALGALSTPVETTGSRLAELAAAQSSQSFQERQADGTSWLPAGKDGAEENRDLLAGRDMTAGKNLPSGAANLAVENPRALAALATSAASAISADTEAGNRDFSQLLRDLHGLQGEAQAARGAGQGNRAASAAIPVPVSSPAWGERLGEQIVWMSRNDVQRAELKLNPAHLGPLSITLRLEGEKATANFTSATPEVRLAIEEAMPRLREMLAAAGVSLTQADVGEQPRQESSAHEMARQHGQDGQANQEESGDDRSHGGKPHETTILTDVPGMDEAFFPRSRRGIGMVDLFA